MPDLLGRQRPDADGSDAAPAATLLRRLRRMWCRLDPVPVDLTLRAELTLFTALDEVEVLTVSRRGALAGARGDDDVVRTLTFAGSTATVTVTLQGTVDGSVRVDGWLSPGEVREIVLSAPGTGAAVGRTRSDTDGRFVVQGVPAGPVSLVVRCAGDRRPAVLTPTFVLA